MNQQINGTRKLIDGTNKVINIVENIYKIWSISCYGTFAFLWIKNTWFDLGGVKSLARKEIMSGWKEECENLGKDEQSPYKGDVLKCITDKRKFINDDIDKAQKIYDTYKKPDERTKALAKESFSIKSLNDEYNNEVVQLLLNQEISNELKSNENPTTGDVGRAELFAYNKIKSDNKIKEDYSLTDEDINKANPISASTSDSEKIGKNEKFELDDKIYRRSLDGRNYEIYFNDEKYYKELKDGKYSGELELVDEIKSETTSEKAVTLVSSGKWAGYVDRLSIDSIYYLRVSKREGDGIPSEVEIWQRLPKLSESKVALGSNNARRYAGPFKIQDCERGSSSDVKERDIFTGLGVQFKDLQTSCKNLLDIDRTINVKNRKQGEKIKGYAIQYAVQETGGLQCFDIMDVNDCLILFSVCDSVMCPASRFTSGGFKVDNVVSTGFFGSVYLGNSIRTLKPYPNPAICIPGIDASLKNYRSLMEGYEQCMITRRDKGENVGICDTIRSVGWCKIAWRESSSFIKLSGGALDWILGKVMPEPKGGGEYGYFQSNVQATGDFLSFFTKEYATTYFSAYRGASTDEIGEELCKAAIYGKVPGVGNLIDKLTKPEGPAQFIGWFTELPNNNLAGQSLNDYEIYYHIYAGEDRERIRYSVYLKDLDDLSKPLYVTRTTGYLNKGDFVDETVRRTERTGYDELCIVIDGKENCGFQRVSSDLALDYFEDKSLEKDARNENIQTEQECNGENGVFTNPGLNLDTTGNIVDALYPGLLDNGLIRICSAENPGKGVDNTTWVDVGSCGENNLKQNLGKCWLNKRSYKDALSVYDIERRKEAEKFFRELGAAELLPDDEVKKQMDELIEYRNLLSENIVPDKDEDYRKTIIDEFVVNVANKFRELEGKTVNVELGAKINYEIGETYYELALYLNKKEIKENPSSTSVAGETLIKNSCEIEYYDQDFLLNYLSKNLFFRFNSNKKYWEQKTGSNEYSIVKAGYIDSVFFPDDTFTDLTSDLASYLTSLEKGYETLIKFAKEKNDKLIISYNGKRNILEKDLLTVKNLKSYCEDVSLKDDNLVENEKNTEDKKFVKTGGGFNVAFDKNSAEINENIKNQIQLYIEETFSVDTLGNTLEIISYTNQEDGSLVLSQNRLNSVLNSLQEEPYNGYIKNLNIKQEARGELSDYGVAITKNGFGAVHVRFVGPGNKEQSLFEGLFALNKKEQYALCEFEYDDKHILNGNRLFKYNLDINKWEWSSSFVMFGSTYRNIFDDFESKEYNYEDGVRKLFQYAYSKKDIVTIYNSEGGLILIYEKLPVDYSIDKIRDICSISNE